LAQGSRMMKSVLLSVAAAWTVPVPSAGYAPASPYYAAEAPAYAPAPADFARLRGAPAPQVVAVRPAANAGMPATVALSAVGLGALLGYGAVGLAARKRQATLAIEAEDMWWGDKDYPPSKVLGIGRNVGSKFYGITSGLAFGIGIYCIAQSNLLNTLSGSTVNGWYVAGALLVPYSWGLHVASWIQKQNGK